MPSITQVATVVVPVSDQERALTFYCGVLGLEKVNDFTYETGERWVEVAPRGAATRLSLVVGSAGIETGVALSSADVVADRETLGGQFVPEGKVTWWAGAPLAGYPAQFLVRDPDGNSLLIVAAP
jgi:catechol 2,3-dioxygenase-like lactoylglutathione lyase family enzyme